MSDVLPWRVLLVGGGAAVGKSTAAQALARRLGLSCLLVDDIRLALQRLTTPAQFPALHYFLRSASAGGVPPETTFQRSPEDLCQALVAIGRLVTGALTPIILHHLYLDAAGPLVLEGCDLLPSLVAGSTLDGFATRGQVRAVFVVEPEEAVILANLQGQGRGMDRYTDATRRSIARMNWCHGQWLRDEAGRYGHPVVDARPWESLVERILRPVSQ